MLELRDYQQEAVDRAVAWFASGGQTFRFNMCVGAGKTVTSVRTVEALNLTGKRVVVAMHTNELKRQFEAEVKRDRLDKSIRWEFYTYQSLVRKFSELECPDLLIIDEVHQGGLKKEEGSYKTIIDHWNPSKILALSATDYNVDDELFGTKTADSSYIFTFQQGYHNKVLNPGIIRVIHSGLEQMLVNNAGATRNISGDTVEDVVETGKHIGVDYSADETVDAISKAQASEAYDRYMFSERGQAAIFFCASIAQARYIVDELFAGTSIKVALATSADPKAAQDNIKLFSQRRLQVLCTVDMLKEGSNFPFLEVAFDLKPSTANHARTMEQKLGRILRKNPKAPKQPSRFYVVLAAPRAHSWDPDKLSGNAKEEFDKLPEQDKALILGSHELVAHMAVDGKLPAEFTPAQRDVVHENPLVEALDHRLPTRHLAPMTEHRYIVTEAKGGMEIGSFDVGDLYSKQERSVVDTKQILLEMARNGEARPKRGHLLYERLATYTQQSSASYDGDFMNALYGTNPAWIPTRTNAVYNKQMLLYMAANGDQKPSSKSKLGWTFLSYTRPDSFSYDKAFTEKFRVLYPGWLKRGRKAVICHETGEKFTSAHAAAKHFGIDPSAIHGVLFGKYKHAKGYTFSYVDEETTTNTGE